MKDQECRPKLNRIEKPVLALLMFLLLVTLISGSIFLYLRGTVNKNNSSKEQYREYKLHYMLITAKDSDFEADFYIGAKEAGKERDILVENLQDTLSGDYSINDQIEIAIAAQVDGIILEANNSQETQAMIDKASNANIPVVTVWEDSPESKRKCFIGNNSYRLGEMYGEQIKGLSGDGECKVTILLDQREEAGPNMVYSGIKDTVSEGVQIESISIDRSDSFSSEETIRSLAVNQDKRPDILVCLNSIDTLCARLAAVDYNIVGQMKILGYYSSAETLDGIEKEIIAASITVDTRRMAEKAVEVLHTYRTNKYINEYELIDAQVIDRENVQLFRNDKEAEDVQE